MLQELAAGSGGTGWAIASMLFFLGIYLVIGVRVFRVRRDVLEARARLALEGDDESRPKTPSGDGTKA